MAETEMEKESGSSSGDDSAGQAENRVSERQRLTYIGFDVFPGNPRELFRPGEEDKLRATVAEKRSKQDIIREDATLLQPRVSFSERVVMTFAALLVLASLFLPWYSVYNETIVENEPPTPPPTETAAPFDVATMLGQFDAASVEVQAQVAGLLPVGAIDSVRNLLAVGDTVAATALVETASEPVVALLMPAGEIDPLADTAAATPAEPAAIPTEDPQEQLITAAIQRTEVIRDRTTWNGISGFGLLGPAGSVLFGSGIGILLTTVLLVLYTVLCIVGPFYCLYGIWGLKGDADSVALKLKKMLKIGWVAPIVVSLTFALSFLGGTYAIDAASVYNSLGDAYGVAVYLGTLSIGLLVSMAGFILLAVKGVEI